MKYILALALLASLFSGCASYTPVAVDTTNAIPATQQSLVGSWLARETQDDPWNYPGVHGLTIRPDGTGEHISSTIFKTGNGRQYWIRKSNILVKNSPEGGVTMDYIGRPVTLEGDGSMGLRYSSPKGTPLILTAQGIVINKTGENGVYYQKVAGPEMSSTATLISSEVASRRQRMLAGGSLPETSSNDDASLHLMTSAMQLGAGVAAMSDGNHAAAQVAFTAAQNQSSAGLQGQAYDYNQAGQDAFRTGAAIGSNGQSVPAYTNQYGSSAATNTVNPSQATSGQSAIVPVDSLMLTAYTDGKAYDLLVVVPYNGPGGKSAGEFCHYFGMTKANAQTLLQNSYAATGTRSQYGAGNPRAQISYRSYPVSLNQNIKYGMEWHVGKMLTKPANYTAYGIVPLR